MRVMYKCVCGGGCVCMCWVGVYGLGVGVGGMCRVYVWGMCVCMWVYMC